MFKSLLLFLSIGIVPLWMIPLQVICQRALQAVKRDFSVQIGALITVVLVNFIYMGVLIYWPELFLSDHLERFAGWLFVAISVNAMAFFYIQIVNISTTSIHMAALLRIYWAGSISQAELLAQYGRKRMVDERVRRLAQLGQIETDGEVIWLRSRILLFLSAPVYLWRRILGMGF